MKKRGQIGLEYLIIMGFVTMILVAVLGIAFIYSESIKDRIKMSQMENCGNKIISASESVFYAGSPSKATISCYFPQNLLSVSIDENEDMLIFELQTNSGVTKIAFSSKVEIITGSNPLDINPGLKRIEIKAQSDNVDIGKKTD